MAASERTEVPVLASSRRHYTQEGSGIYVSGGDHCAVIFFSTPNNSNHTTTTTTQQPSAMAAPQLSTPLANVVYRRLINVPGAVPDNLPEVAGKLQLASFTGAFHISPEKVLTHYAENLAALCLHKCGEGITQKHDLVNIGTITSSGRRKAQSGCYFCNGRAVISVLKAKCDLNGDIFAALVEEMDKQLAIMIDAAIDTPVTDNRNSSHVPRRHAHGVLHNGNLAAIQYLRLDGMSSGAHPNFNTWHTVTIAPNLVTGALDFNLPGVFYNMTIAPVPGYGASVGQVPRPGSTTAAAPQSSGPAPGNTSSDASSGAGQQD